MLRFVPSEHLVETRAEALKKSLKLLATLDGIASSSDPAAPEVPRLV